MTYYTKHLFLYTYICSLRRKSIGRVHRSWLYLRIQEHADDGVSTEYYMMYAYVFVTSLYAYALRSFLKKRVACFQIISEEKHFFIIFRVKQRICSSRLWLRNTIFWYFSYSSLESRTSILFRLELIFFFSCRRVETSNLPSIRHCHGYTLQRCRWKSRLLRVEKRRERRARRASEISEAVVGRNGFKDREWTTACSLGAYRP